MIRFTAAAAALAAALSCAPSLAAGDAFVCMEDSQEKCDRENENMRLFIRGHDAFERGRASGDLREAHDIARELIDRKDERHGGILMKYVYLQVGQGVHKDFVEAYKWIQSDLQAGAKYKRLNLEHIRDSLKARMSPEQLAAVGG